MPVELLHFAPLYVIVGAYRLLTDPQLWTPIWLRTRTTLKRALLFLPLFVLLSYPSTRIYVTWILACSPFAPAKIEDAQYFGVSVVTFTIWSLILGQISMILEWALKREVTKASKDVYEATVASRGKSADFWKPYFEEWELPPVERAQRSLLRQSWYAKLSGPLVRMLVLKGLLLPLGFIPFLSLFVSSALQSLLMARLLHQPYFLAKKMTPLQIELFVIERQTQYRSFGFVAALFQRLPIVGLVFRISNRIGAAMWAHDLEKMQEQYRTGDIQPTQRYISKTAALPQTGLPDDFTGGFPTKKGPVRIERDGSETTGFVMDDISATKRAVGGLSGGSHSVEGTRRRVPPPLPPRGKEL